MTPLPRPYHAAMMGRAGWGRTGGVESRVGPGGPVGLRAGWGLVVGARGAGGGPGSGEAGRVGRRLGWYGPIAENFYTARKGVCDGGVKNTLLLGQNRVDREMWRGCREKLRTGKEKMVGDRKNSENGTEKKRLDRRT